MLISVGSLPKLRSSGWLMHGEQIRGDRRVDVDERVVGRGCSSRRARSRPCRPRASAARSRCAASQESSCRTRAPPRADGVGVSVCRRVDAVRQERIVDSGVLEEEVLRSLGDVHGDVEILVVRQGDPDGLIEAQVQAVALGRGSGDAATLAGLGADHGRCRLGRCRLDRCRLDRLSTGPAGLPAARRGSSPPRPQRFPGTETRSSCQDSFVHPTPTQRADECFG